MDTIEAEITAFAAGACSSLRKLYEVDSVAAVEQGRTLLFLIRRLAEMNTSQMNLLIPLIYDTPLTHREGTLDLTKRLQTRRGHSARFLGCVSHLVGQDYVFAVADRFGSSPYGLQEDVLTRRPSGKKYEDRDDDEDIIIATAESIRSGES